MDCNGAMNLSRQFPLICCLLLAACQQPPARKPASAAPPGTAIQQLGPYRFAIPVDYFHNQHGPSPDAVGSLVMLLPELGPRPTNALHHPSHLPWMEVQYSFYYVDKVPIDAVLERATSRWYQTGDAYEDNDPRAQLALRPAALQLHGLTRHDVDPVLFEQHKQRAIAKFGKWHGRPEDGMGDDWYIALDAQGRLRSLIKCDARQQPDGLLWDGQQYRLTDSKTTASCHHHFIDRKHNYRIHASYARVHLAQWQAIETAFHQLLDATQLD